jgi:formate hydrogenlyase transcriptional activator
MGVSTFPSDTTAARYQTLLEISESIVSHRQISTLLGDLAVALKRIVRFDGISVTLYDSPSGTVTLLAAETGRDFQAPVGRVFNVERTPVEIVLRSKRPHYVAEIPDEENDSYPDVHGIMRGLGIRSYVVLPMNTARCPFLGTLNFGSTRRDAYTPAETGFMTQVARQVAVALENAKNYETAAEYQRELARERDHLRLLLEVNNAVVSELDTPSLFRAIANSIRSRLGVEYISLALWNESTQQLRRMWIDFPDERGQRADEGLVEAATPPGRAFATGQAIVADRSEFDGGVVQACCVPLVSRGRALGTMSMGSRSRETFTDGNVALLCEVAGQIAIALDNALSYKRIEELNARLAEEKVYLEDEIRTQFRFDEIIGRSPALVSVLRQVETVAPSDSAVVISGETGTGKELIARAIHDLSSRKSSTFVKLNCAAIPTGLIESELFGHERGAFTGAISRRIGRFELADGGTLFLDEIGEIPLELQPKLLRVLQEREFERLGSSRTLRVDVRVVAATNRDLMRMVRERKFRDDLFYRLNVFPIQMPPLRERREDIPVLVRHFAQQCARRMSKQITSIPSETMEALSRYSWPGNIRELQNLIERAVIVSQGSVLQVPLEDLASTARVVAEDAAVTLEEAERDHILEALRATRWVLAGPNGAAARLGMKRSTLQFRMKKLGIERPG